MKNLEQFRASKVQLTNEEYHKRHDAVEYMVTEKYVNVYGDGYFIEHDGNNKAILYLMNNEYHGALSTLEALLWNDHAKYEYAEAGNYELEQNLAKAVEEFSTAYQKIVVLMYENNDDHVANLFSSSYPFDKSFDELNVELWAKNIHKELTK